MNIAAVLLASMILMACRRDVPSPEEEPLLVDSDSVVMAGLETVESGPRITGALEPEARALIRAEVSGTLIAVTVGLGDGVRRRQVLARIDAEALRDRHRSARSVLRAAEVDLAEARRHEARIKRLVAAGALAQRELELQRSAVTAAEARVQEARAQLATAAEELGRATVRSPMNGVVSAQPAHEGDVVGVGEHLFTVIEPSSMRLEASIASHELGSVAEGMRVRFRVRGYPDEVFDGRVRRIAPAADRATRQVSLIVSIPNPDARLLAGLFAEGRVISESRRAVVVPEDAVEILDGAARVMTVAAGRTESVVVELGIRDPVTGRVVIRSGLRSGDRVLIGPARDAPPGSRIQIVDAGLREAPQ